MENMLTRDSLVEAKFEILEGSGEVDGKHVLAKVRGPFFVPNGVSRNKRFYSKSLWEKQLSRPEIKARLSERRMFGTIGHEKAIDEQAIREGAISHIITKLELDGGIGETLIIDTPAGRVLNTLLRVGTKMFVSSRAAGTFQGEVNGIPAVSEETYDLNTFDFVLDPGFLQASPSLVESLNKEDLKALNLIESENKPKGDIMSQELLEKLAKENSKMQSDLEKSLATAEKLQNENLILAEDNKDLQTKVANHESMAKELAEYRKLGSPSEISAVMDKSEKVVEAYSSIGSPKEINQTIEKAATIIEDNNKFFTEFGGKNKIRRAFDVAEATIGKYLKLGSVSEISAVMEAMEKNVVTLQESKVAGKIAKLAKDLNVSEAKIKAVYGKISESEIKELFKGVVAESVPVDPKIDKYRKTTSIQESKPAVQSESRSRAMRLMEGFSRPATEVK